MVEITYDYIKLRRTFGAQPLYCEQGPELLDSIMPDHTEQKKYILRNPVNQMVQHGPIYSEHHVNTFRAEYTTTGTNHAEGGWPHDVNINDPEATQRYRRRIEKDDAYIHCVMSLNEGIEHYADQNNAIEMYQTYFQELKPYPPIERISCRTVNEYRDKFDGERHISSIAWQPEGGHKLAVTYVNLDNYRFSTASTDCYIWDVENATEPESFIDTPSALLDLQFGLKDINLMIGGLLSGQVGYWDRRHGPRMLGCCPPHVAHREHTKSVMFIASKTGMEFFSGGLDGCCKWWDLRKLSEPLDQMIIDPVDSNFDTPSMAKSCGVTVVEYEPTLPTRFMVGTENGLIVGGNRKGKTPLEKLPLKMFAQAGPVLNLERNPSFTKIFLSVGDWTVKMWCEETKDSPIIWSPAQRSSYTAATWSPARASLIVLTNNDGVISVWDWLRKQNEPVLTMQVCEEPLLRVKVHEAGQLVACGSQKGNMYMVELSHTLAQSDPKDKNLLTVMFDRETKREKILEAKLREIKLKMRQAEEGGGEVIDEGPDPTIGDKDLSEATAEFNATVRKAAQMF